MYTNTSSLTVQIITRKRRPIPQMYVLLFIKISFRNTDCLQNHSSFQSGYKLINLCSSASSPSQLINISFRLHHCTRQADILFQLSQTLYALVALRRINCNLISVAFYKISTISDDTGLRPLSKYFGLHTNKVFSFFSMICTSWFSQNNDKVKRAFTCFSFPHLIVLLKYLLNRTCCLLFIFPVRYNSNRFTIWKYSKTSCP